MTTEAAALAAAREAAATDETTQQAREYGIASARATADMLLHGSGQQVMLIVAQSMLIELAQIIERHRGAAEIGSPIT